MPMNSPFEPKQVVGLRPRKRVVPTTEASTISSGGTERIARRHEQLKELDGYLRNLEYRLDHLARRRATLYSEASTEAAPQRTTRRYPAFRKSPLSKESFGRRMVRSMSERRQTRIISWKAEPSATVQTRATSATLGVGMGARHVCDDFRAHRAKRGSFWKRLRILFFGA
ncbi:hypothetical protein BCR37DRAFT_390623 [Protomyces lactucae-debilis]|uniref:Uncharacterized protein n=1 Tax=Protomyces lactucae-debilis TaxID=2754530 RepID=A0A1Y2FSC7_PROLT|nr:uncharacterized protein BCR37DRAFT_390623 [Protomyces lactucae-debilis]ORY86893.1 hypothetical protein BCR37DRAFT_390623 [Protomyces lactucae-debilis]